MPGDTDPATRPPGGSHPVEEPHSPEEEDGAPSPYSGERLPSRPSGGVVVAGLFATLDRVLLNRPRPVTEISEEYHDPWATKDGISVDGLDDHPGRPEPPDRSGARL
jgi:hypothetical protein